MAEGITISPAQESHIPLILRFIRELAEYEKLASKVVASEALLRESLFGKQPMAEVLIAYFGDEPAGFAVFFHNFSTFAGRAGIYLEDLFVEPKFRRKGIGKALLAHLAKLTKERECARLEWAVLDWNAPAIRFYKKLGAEALGDWTVYRVSGGELDSLAKLTASAQPGS
ncbi:MAG TPA: GNAT family N-acetyltransferase [Bryobacteraceae bacterium]|nr:GNAT family N-acetyltransferase [Bryobacteraceae bacterium]